MLSCVPLVFAFCIGECVYVLMFQLMVGIRSSASANQRMVLNEVSSSSNFGLIMFLWSQHRLMLVYTINAVMYGTAPTQTYMTSVTGTDWCFKSDKCLMAKFILESAHMTPSLSIRASCAYCKVAFCYRARKAQHNIRLVIEWTLQKA